MNKIFIISAIILLVSCRPEHSNLNYKIVYKNDKDGNTLRGSKKDLISSIRGGAEIKIGWGWKGENHSIEHLSVPIWIAILDESEVIAHLDPQVLSKTNWDNLSASYKDTTLLHQEWRVVITTKGDFDAVWYDRNNAKVIKRKPQKHTMTWFAKNKSADNKPLFLNE